MKRRPASISPADQHRDWLSLVDSEGPFLSVPVLARVWPNGMDRSTAADSEFLELMDVHKSWLKSQSANHEKWIKTVLVTAAKWSDNLVLGTKIPSRLLVEVPEHRSQISHWGVLFAPDADQENDVPLALVQTVAPGRSLRGLAPEGWSASPIDRMSIALRRLNVPIGIVTNGRWWSVVWAEGATSTGSAIFDCAIWGEEKLLRDAFFSLIGIQRFVGVQAEDRLSALFAESLLQQEDITEELGKQVRKAVELLIQSFSEARIEELRQGKLDPIPNKEREPYEAAVTIMMRIVFMLFAEERGLLPVNQELYGNAYAISGTLNLLEDQARDNEDMLDSSTSVWHQILSTSEALFRGATFEDMRMPAYGGSLFDPARFPWLIETDSQSGLRLAVSDRVMLHVLRSIQIVKQFGQARKISFREVDVEQIGYIYEGLLGYTSKNAGDQTILGLIGSPGLEPEISLEKLIVLRKANKSNENFIESLMESVEEDQPGSKLSGKRSLLSALDKKVESGPAKSKLGAVTGHDKDLIEKILPFYNLLRLDLRQLPYVVPPNGLVVTETRSRRNAGAHYTPRFLAEEVVLHALEPLVYSPGPMQTEDRTKWKLKNSADILDLRIADIAVGSGAFLVAAARFLAERLVESWQEEGVIVSRLGDKKSDNSEDPLAVEAMREVISRCLYGADINEMAVEMCKLSLWLVSLDPGKPFTFLDDKVLHGNSLLGLTSAKQLEQLHINPVDESEVIPQLYRFDVQGPLNEAIRLREEIASSPVDDFDAHRSAVHKSALLSKSHEITKQLNLLADGVIVAGLIQGGKPGSKLESAYQALSYLAERAFGLSSKKDLEKFSEIISDGLTPTVPTDYERWKPLHWILEVPDVMERGGFDSIIGNPPFLMSKKIGGAMGSNLREWNANIIAQKPGKADLVAYFFRRAYFLLRSGGTLGLIGAKAISEGDSVAVGIEPIVEQQGCIFRADKNRVWPTRNAGTNISLVWISKSIISVTSNLDGEQVQGISGLLTNVESNLTRPRPLNRNMHYSAGSYFLGDGFLITEENALEMISLNPQNRKVIFPYVNGELLNSQPDRKGVKYIIDFRQRSETQAKVFKEPWSWVQKYVKPERMKKDRIKYPKMVDQWWTHWNDRPELYSILDAKENAVVISIVSSYMVPAYVEANSVFSSALAVWPNSDFAFFAILSSWQHRSWGQWWGSSMRGDFRYSLSDCFETFPLPKRTLELDKFGREIDELQRSIALDRSIGLTKIYGLINKGASSDADILKLKNLHEDLDRAVVSAYGFNIELGPYELSNFCNVQQWGPPASQRIEILQLLLAENVRQQAEGVIEWPN